MFSLARFVNEQLNFFGDVLDKRPSQVSRSTKDPLILVIDDKMPLKDKVAKLLNSELASQQVWAITNIAKLVSQGVDCKELVQELPRMFLSKSAKVELAAAKTAHALLSYRPDHYTHIFAQPIIDRIAAVPAFEYAECIEKMATAVDPSDVAGTIIPLLDRLFEQDEQHQHAGCQMLRLLPPSSLQLTQDAFMKYLPSKVLVNEYLSEIAEKYQNHFGENWIAIDLPQRLSEMGSEYRIGVCRYFVDFVEKIRASCLYSIIHSAVDWARDDEIVALALLDRSPIIAKSRFVDLQAKVRNLVGVVAASKDAEKRIKLIALLAKHSILLNGHESAMYRILSTLGSDKEASVRCAFMDNIQKLYDLCETQNSKNGVIQVYHNLLRDEKETSVIEKLVHPYMLVKFAESKHPSNMGLVLDLASKFLKRWRFFSKILQTIEQFPEDSILVMLKKLLLMIEDAVFINPQSLMRSVISFYTFIIRSRFEILKFPDLLRYMHVKYGKHKHYQQRIVYIKLAGSLMHTLSREEYLEYIWPCVLEYKDEEIMFVRAKVLEFLLVFGKEFDSLECPQLSHGMESICCKYSDDSDPYVQSLLKEVKLLITTKKVMSAQCSSERLPALSKTPEKPPVPLRNTSQRAIIRKPPTPGRAGTNGAGGYRVPSPSISTRRTIQGSSIRVGSVVKSSSNSTLNQTYRPR